MVRNFITSNNDIPPLYGLREDHKVITDEIKGPPVCGAVTSSNFRISYFLSQIIIPLIQLAPECCDITEDLLSKIHLIDETEDLTGCILGSMDVEALYPSIDIDFAVENCVELLKNSDITFESVNTGELGLYITVLTTKEEREKEGISKFMYAAISWICQGHYFGFHMYVCIGVCEYEYVCVCVCLCLWLCMCMRVYLCQYAYVYVSKIGHLPQLVMQNKSCQV